MSTGQELQAAYQAHRIAHHTAFEALRASGAFTAPEHLRRPRQAEPGQAEPLRADDQLVEAG